MARARRRISTEYCVHEGRPSWHQQKAGHVSAAMTCGIWSKREAERELRKFKKHHPGETAFITTRRKLRHFAGARR